MSRLTVGSLWGQGVQYFEGMGIVRMPVDGRHWLMVAILPDKAALERKYAEFSGPVKKGSLEAFYTGYERGSLVGALWLVKVTRETVAHELYHFVEDWRRRKGWNEERLASLMDKCTSDFWRQYPQGWWQILKNRLTGAG